MYDVRGSVNVKCMNAWMSERCMNEMYECMCPLAGVRWLLLQLPVAPPGGCTVRPP